MNQAHNVIRSFKLPTTINAFVQQSSRDQETDALLFVRIAEDLGLDIKQIPNQQLTTFVQYATIEMLNNANCTAQEAQAIALERTNKLFNKHPYFNLMECTVAQQQVVVDNQIKIVVQQAPRDKKIHARQVFDAHRQSLSTAELVNLISKELHISKANSRYYVTSFNK